MNTADLLLIRRGITKLILRPEAPLMGFGMSLFFLIVYYAGIGGVGFLDAFGPSGYFAFIFPIALVSLAMGSSAGASQALNADMQSGYFRRLYLSPVSRRVLIAAPMLADIASTLVFSALIVAIGALFGMPFRFGFLSMAGVLLLSMLWAITLCGFSIGVMIRTGRHQSAAIITNTVFPLIFLSTTYMPRELITSDWLLFVSWGNPVTYVLEGMRFLLAGTSPAYFFTIAVAVLGCTSIASILFAFKSADKIKF